MAGRGSVENFQFPHVGVVLGVLVGFAVLVPRLSLLGAVLLSLLCTWYALTTRRYLLLILSLGFLFRVFVIAVELQLGVLLEPPIASNHADRAMAVARAWQAGNVLDPGIGGDPKRVVVAHLYAPCYLLFGFWEGAGRFGSALFGTLVGYPVYRIARSVAAEQREALFATAVVVFWPSLVVRSVVIQREVLIVLAMLTIVWIAVWWTERIRLIDLLLLAPGMWLLSVFRPENLIIVGGTVLLAVMLRVDQFKPSLSLGRTVAGFVVVGILLYLVLPVEAFLGSHLRGYRVSPAIIDDFAHNRAKGRSAYLVGLHYRSWLDIVLLAPLKIVYYLFSPLPWQITELKDLFAAFSAWGVFVATLLVPGAIRSLRDRSRQVLVLVAYATVGITLYAIVEMNYGAAFRRRIQFIPILLILATIYLCRHLTIRYRTPDSGG